MILKYQKPCAWEKAFSLVEVAMALGLISVMLVPMLGLLGVSFNAMHASNASLRTSIIAQKIIAEAQMAPFANLANREYYLDIEGKEVPPQQSVFHASMRVSKQPADGVVSSPNIARVSIYIAGSALDAEGRGYFATIANLGQPD